MVINSDYIQVWDWEWVLRWSRLEIKQCALGLQFAQHLQETQGQLAGKYLRAKIG